MKVKNQEKYGKKKTTGKEREMEKTNKSITHFLLFRRELLRKVGVRE